MKKVTVTLVVALLCSVLFAAAVSESDGRIKIKVLILPKFEEGELYGDEPGEAQYYYEGFLVGGEEYDIRGGYGKHKLHVKDGVALYVTGLGKVNAALSTLAVLSDDRFDFSVINFGYVLINSIPGINGDITIFIKQTIISNISFPYFFDISGFRTGRS